MAKTGHFQFYSTPAIHGLAEYIKARKTANQGTNLLAEKCRGSQKIEDRQLMKEIYFLELEC